MANPASIMAHVAALAAQVSFDKPSKTALLRAKGITCPSPCGESRFFFAPSSADPPAWPVQTGMEFAFVH